MKYMIAATSENDCCCRDAGKKIESIAMQKRRSFGPFPSVSVFSKGTVGLACGTHASE